MIVKILGALDILAGICFWLFSFFNIFNIISSSFLTLLALYLIAKGIIFLISADIASIGDVVSGLIILISLATAIPEIIIILISLYLIQKGIFSML